MSTVNEIIHADCLDVLHQIPDSSINMIYIDPPFNVGTAKEFDDSWENVDSYLSWFKCRVEHMYRVLRITGAFFVHLDWRIVHYVKCLLDTIFGYDNFVNEIIWCYKAGNNAQRKFINKHQTILFYAKNIRKYKFHQYYERSYNKDGAKYGLKGVNEYKDNVGWYTMVGMKDYWFINKPVHISKNRVCYPTEKPVHLLELLIKAVTNEGGLVADFFCGSGTTAVAAIGLGRRFLAVDNSIEAINLTHSRIASLIVKRKFNATNPIFR